MKTNAIRRDEFVIAALNALIVRDGTPCNPEAQVKVAYYYADLMLDWRQQNVTFGQEAEQEAGS